MAGLVLGTSPSLMWQRSDIIIVINDGRSRCCGFWHAVGCGHGGCVNGWELNCKQVPNVTGSLSMMSKKSRDGGWIG